MDERETARVLRAVTDEPVDPPEGFADDLWSRIEAELASDVSATDRIAVDGSDREMHAGPEAPARPRIPG
ncbi:MAG: hypothetical protein R3324_17655, partial [Halobacteriales archaeon]|nr:hypothetical protein [Halobacteriales archaeon]